MEIVTGIVAFLAGAAVMAYMVMIGMRKMMVVEHKSNHSFEETASRIEKVIHESEAWSCPFSKWDLADVLVKKNKALKNVDKLTVYFICNAGYAGDVIDDTPKMASIMPCAWALYQRNGQTYIGTMNIPMMAIPFKGVISKTFSAVGRDEKEMMHKILN